MKIAAVSELPSGFKILTRRTVKAMHSDTGDTISAIGRRQLRAVSGPQNQFSMQDTYDINLPTTSWPRVSRMLTAILV